MAIREDTIVTRYQAVTISHEQGIDQIRIKQQQLRKEMDDWNKSAEEHQKQTKDAWDTVAKGIVGIGAAVLIGKESLKSLANETRLSMASAGADIDSLSKASGGLQSRIELMTFAAQAQHGAFKLTEDQMETTERAIRGLTRAGFDHEEVTKKVTDAVVALKDDGLKDLGIRIRATTTDSEKFKAIMEALADRTKGVDDASSTGAESVQRIGVKFEDATEKIKVSLGKVVVALGPLLDMVGQLADKTAGVISMVAEGWENIGGVLSATFGGEDARKAFAKAHGLDYDSEHGLNAGYATSGDKFENWMAMGRNPVDLLNLNRDVDAQQSRGDQRLGFDAFGAITNKLAQGQYLLSNALDVAGGKLEKWKNGVDAAREAAKAWNEEMKRGTSEYAKQVTDELVTKLEAEIEKDKDDKIAASRLELQKYGGDDLSALLTKKLDTQKLAEPAIIAGKEQGFVDRFFGGKAPEQFDMLRTAGDLFNGFADAVGGAYDALITGSEPAGEAFKKLIGTSVAASGKQMLIEGIKNEAMALASLAFGDVAGFVTHQAAAAEFFAGAALAGVIASELGAGGGSSGKGSGSGGAAPSGSSSSAPAAPSQNIFVIGDDYAEDTPRMRQLRAKRALGLAAFGSNAVIDV